MQIATLGASREATLLSPYEPRSGGAFHWATLRPFSSPPSVTWYDLRIHPGEAKMRALLSVLAVGLFVLVARAPDALACHKGELCRAEQ